MDDCKCSAGLTGNSVCTASSTQTCARGVGVYATHQPVSCNGFNFWQTCQSWSRNVDNRLVEFPDEKRNTMLFCSNACAIVPECTFYSHTGEWYEFGACYLGTGNPPNNYINKRDHNTPVYYGKGNCFYNKWYFMYIKCGPCRLCSAGTYKEHLGNVACTACPENSFSPIESINITHCTCNVGKFWG